MRADNLSESQSLPTSERPQCLQDMEAIATKSTWFACNASFFCYLYNPFSLTKKHKKKSKLYVVGHVLYFVGIFQLYSHNVNNFIVIT